MFSYRQELATMYLGDTLTHFGSSLNETYKAFRVLDSTPGLKNVQLAPETSFQTPNIFGVNILAMETDPKYFPDSLPGRINYAARTASALQVSEQYFDSLNRRARLKFRADDGITIKVESGFTISNGNESRSHGYRLHPDMEFFVAKGMAVDNDNVVGIAIPIPSKEHRPIFSRIRDSVSEYAKRVSLYESKTLGEAASEFMDSSLANFGLSSDDICGVADAMRKLGLEDVRLANKLHYHHINGIVICAKETNSDLLPSSFPGEYSVRRTAGRFVASDYFYGLNGRIKDGFNFISSYYSEESDGVFNVSGSISPKKGNNRIDVEVSSKHK